MENQASNVAGRGMEARANRVLDRPGQIAFLLWGIMLGVVCVLVLLKPTSPSLNLLWRDKGRAWIDGQDLYEHPQHYGFRYGPPVAVLLTVLTALPLGIGAALVRLVNAAVLLAAALGWLKRLAPGRMEANARAAFVILLGALSLPNIYPGQFNPLVVGLLLGSLTAVHDRRWNLAALLLAMATVFKVYPLAFAALLLVVYPRQLLLRLPLALLAVLAVPFAAQDFHYVLHQYQEWGNLLRAADHHRRFLPLTEGETYRDLFYLFRLFHIPASLPAYTSLQAVTGLAAAVLCRSAVRRGLPARVILWHVLVVGTCWLALCGPASEPRTYILIVPALAWWSVWTYRHGPRLSSWLVAQACGLQLLCVLSSFTSEGALFFRSAGLHPISALFLLAGHLSGVSALSSAEKAPAPTAEEGQSPLATAA